MFQEISKREISKKVIWIPRPESPSTIKLVAGLEEQGLKVFAEPLISIQSLPKDHLKLRSYAELCEYDWLVCVSGKAVKFWLESISSYPADLGFDKDQPLKKLPPIWVPGKTTAEYVKQQGGEAILPTGGSGSPAIYQQMLASLGGDKVKLNNKKILMICGRGGGKELDKELGREIDKELVYHTQSVNDSRNIELRNLISKHIKLDYIWITSESILEAFADFIRALPTPPTDIRYHHLRIIAGSKRLGSLTKNMMAEFMEDYSFQVICLEEPTNEALLHYLDGARSKN